MPRIRIVDIALKSSSKYLYKCLAPMPFRKYRKMSEYLKTAVPKGFHKRILLLGNEIVGQIEYAPSEASAYPIFGEDIIVVNCIWVLRRAKGHSFGKLLLNNMIKSEEKASGFATIGLEGHWSPWFKREHWEQLGFKSADSIRIRHVTKHTDWCFKIHLMWLPVTKNASPQSGISRSFLKA